jgi:hypothetical protein
MNKTILKKIYLENFEQEQSEDSDEQGEFKDQQELFLISFT